VICQSDLNLVSQHIEYPAPPRIHWSVLLAGWIGSAFLFAVLAPPAYQKLLNSLVVDAWVFRLCIWIRNLDPDTRSPFWCDVYLVVELAYALLCTRPNLAHTNLTADLGFASFCLGVWTIYLIRSDLLKHYNRREPYGLELNGLMTYLFSFLYFQSRLYPIAKAKQRETDQKAGVPIHS
jgi:hypothetical protein